MSILDESQALSDIFIGSDLAFGRADLTSKVTQTGKHEARCWTEKRAVTLEDWRRHVEGISGIGIPPINSENKVRFGAIDVDQYRGLSLEDLCRDIEESGLPLVVCRSKSGGPHIYLFVSEWVPAALMVEKLDMLAGFFGFGSAEIFPKQVTLGTDGSGHADYGNWINMPYFGGLQGQRYGLSPTGAPLETCTLFAEYARSRTISADELAALSPADAGDDSILPQGPPCLNHLFRRGKTIEGNRNILLCNVAVYVKKAFPDSWKDKLDEYNRRFTEPLPGREVESIKKSYDKKDYRYQCSKSPLCDFCNSQVCKNREFGIETGGILPNNRSLTVINTAPPVWYLDITSGEAQVQRIALSTDELQKPVLFQKRCMEALKIMPPVPKPGEWREIVQGLLKHCTQVDMPEEMSPKGQLIELLETFIVDHASTDNPEDILRGLVFSGPLEYWFRWKDFKQFLERNRFDLLKQHQILAILKTEMQVNRAYQKLAGKGCNYLRLPRANLNPGNPERLQVVDRAEPF